MLRIAVTNARKYTEGELVFEWLELPATEEEIQETFKEIGIDDVVLEEWFISDYETDIPALKVFTNLEALNDLAERYEYNLKGYEQDAVQAVIEAHGYDFEKAMDIVERGTYTLYGDCESLADLAEQFVDDGYFGATGEMGNLVNYIDYEALGRDLRHDGYIVTSKGVLLVD